MFTLHLHFLWFALMFSCEYLENEMWTVSYRRCLYLHLFIYVCPLIFCCYWNLCFWYFFMMPTICYRHQSVFLNYFMTLDTVVINLSTFSPWKNKKQKCIFLPVCVITDHLVIWKLCQFKKSVFQHYEKGLVIYKIIWHIKPINWLK